MGHDNPVGDAALLSSQRRFLSRDPLLALMLVASKIARNLGSLTAVATTAVTGGFRMTVTEDRSETESTAYSFSVTGRFRTGIAS